MLFAIREQRISLPKKKSKAKRPAKLSFDEVLAEVNLEELRDFIRHQKEGDRNFRDSFLLFFSDKNPSLNIFKKYEDLLRQLVHTHSDRGFMDYRSTFSFVKATDSVFHAADAAIAKQRYHDAFSIGKALCQETIKVIQSCDDSAGNIGGIVSSSVEILSTIAEVKDLSPELREQLLDYATKSLQERKWLNYGDFGYDLLNVVKKIAENANPDIYLNLLNRLLKTHTGDYSDYEQAYFKKEKIRFLERIGRTSEAQDLIAENMDIVEVREKEVRKAIEKKDFSQAKVLIQEGSKIAEEKGHPGTVNKWERLLLEVARQEQDIDAVRYFTRKFAFDRGFSKQHYQAWKASFSTAEWTETITRHIQEVILDEKSKPAKFAWNHASLRLFRRLSPVFIEEEMWSDLLKLIPEEAEENMLSVVHPHLAKRFPKEVLALYLKMLSTLGDKVSNRKEYQHLTSIMKKVKQDIEDSHTAIDELARTLMKKYSRRPAMLEELRKILKW